MAEPVDPKRVKDIKIKTGIVKRFCFLFFRSIIKTYMFDYFIVVRVASGLPENRRTPQDTLNDHRKTLKATGFL